MPGFARRRAKRGEPVEWRHWRRRFRWRETGPPPGLPGFALSLDAIREELAGGNVPVEHGVMLRGALRW